MGWLTVGVSEAVFQDDVNCAFAMEYLGGGELLQLISEGESAQLPDSVAAFYLAQAIHIHLLRYIICLSWTAGDSRSGRIALYGVDPSGHQTRECGAMCERILQTSRPWILQTNWAWAGQVC